MRAFIFFNLILFGSGVMSQTYFSVIPDFGGDKMEGRVMNILPMNDSIKIIGLVHQDSVPGFEGGNWPVMASFSYQGIFGGAKYLIDSLYSDGFRYVSRPIRLKNDTTIMLYDRRSVNEKYLKSYLLEINIHTGQILRSKIITDEVNGIEPFMPRTFGITNSGWVYLINFIELFGDYSQVLTVLDSAWNVITQRQIDMPGSRFYANLLQVEENGQIVVVGINLGEETPVWWKSRLYRQLIDTAFSTVKVDFPESEIEHSIILGDAYPVIRATSGDWIIASQEVVETNDCQGCSIYVPYLVCLSPDFHTIKWETRMHDGDERFSEPYQYVSSVTEVSDGYIFAADRNGNTGPETCALLGKVSLNGDSLWTRRYYPSGWSLDQALWFQIKDIKTTPFDGIVVGGHGADIESDKILPWIMHLDKDGCLEPGCLSTPISPEGDILPLGLQVHPNPATDHVYIHIMAEKMTSPPYSLEVFTPDGKSVHSATIDFADTYYMLDVRSWADGTYIVHVSDQEQRAVSRQLIVVH